MTKEQLTVLGLTDEQAKAVISVAEAEQNDLVPKADLDAALAAKGAVESRLASTETLIKGLVKDAKGSTLEEQVNDFRQTDEAEREQLRTQLAEIQFNHALDRALGTHMPGAGEKKLKAAKALLDTSKLKLGDDGSLSGLDEQIKPLRDSEAWLFGEKQQIDTGSEGNFRRQTATPGEGSGIGERLGKLAAQPVAESPYFK